MPKRNQIHLFSKFVLVTFVLTIFVNFFVLDKRAQAASCPEDWIYTPQIEVNIASNTFFSDSGGSVDLPYGVSIPFTVGSHNHPPSSIITVTYPYGSVTTYPSQSDGVFRSFTIPAIYEAINGGRSLNVSLNPNCTYPIGHPQVGEPMPVVNLNLPIYVTAPSCVLSSFTCDGNATLAWSTTNCSSRSISPTIGSVVGTGNTQGTVGTSYTLTADGITSTAYCPAPALATTGGGSQTVTPGQSVTLPSFNFNNTGESGSVIHYQDCVDTPDPTGGITTNYIDCPPSKDLIAP